jgi:hypothetical protein
MRHRQNLPVGSVHLLQERHPLPLCPPAASKPAHFHGITQFTYHRPPLAPQARSIAEKAEIDEGFPYKEISPPR